MVGAHGRTGVGTTEEIFLTQPRLQGDGSFMNVTGNSMIRIVAALWNLWATGALYILAALGFCAYGLLWFFRYMQQLRFTQILVLVLLLVLAGVVGGGYLLMPLPGPHEPVTVVIEQGETMRRVSKRLETMAVIRSSRILVLYMRLTGRDKSIQSGIYTFRTRDGLRGVLTALEHPRPVELPVTFPEGLTLWETARIAAQVFDIDSSEFVRLCSDSQMIRQVGLSVGTLEGYLFPDTYRFPLSVSARQIITTMVRQFKRTWGSLTFDFSHGVELDQAKAVILASIVEKEAAVPEERVRIAGVFHNRLRLGYTLGADPTVRYAVRKFSGPLRVSELNNPSPYNTRKHRGLPPGPICSPGRGALQAAVSPLATRELYFVARWDGSGAHDFSETMAEHNRKKTEIRMANKRRLRSTAERGRQ